MRISDWSSDVCSSDLPPRIGAPDVRGEGTESPLPVLSKIEVVIVRRRRVDQRRSIGMAAEELRRQRLRVAADMMAIGTQEIREDGDVIAHLADGEKIGKAHV